MIGEAEDDKLIEELNSATSSQEPAIILEKGTEEQTPATPPDPEDLDKGSTEGAAPEFSPLKARGMAERWVRMFSAVMKFIFTPLYKKTILAKGDIQKVQDFRRANAGKSEKELEEAVHSDHDMWPVTNRFDRYMKAVEEIPLDNDEVELIAEPLSELIIKYKRLQLGPEWMLAIAVGIVILPRLVNLVPDMGKIFTSEAPS